METLNRQEVFDRAYEAVIAQGKPSMNQSYDCVYRSPDGLKCALGHLIPDELYDESIEMCVPGSPPELNTYRSGYYKLIEILEKTFGVELNQGDLDFLAEIQNAHDCARISSFIKDFKMYMETIRIKHDLA